MTHNSVRSFSFFPFWNYINNYNYQKHFQGCHASGKFKFFQGQGIVREFCKLSGKFGIFGKCQGILKIPDSLIYELLKAACIYTCIKGEKKHSIL